MAFSLLVCLLIGGLAAAALAARTGHRHHIVKSNWARPTGTANLGNPHESAPASFLAAATAASATSAPAMLPAFARAIPVALTPDSAHFTVRVSVSPNSDPTTAPPSLSGARFATDVFVTLDTGSTELFLFNSAFCARSLRQRPSACADARSTFSQSGVRLNFWTHVDGEDLMEKSTGGNLVNGYISIETGDGMPPLTTCSCNLSTFMPRYDAPGANPAAATSSCATSNFIIGTDIGTVAGAFPVQRWRFEDGMLGLAYNALVSSASAVSPWLQLLAPHQLADRAPIVTLDLRPSAQPSRVLVGGIDERYRADYQWAAPAVVPNFHAFHVFDVTLCGQSLVANFTELMPLTAVIDTGASCLTLPAELFDAAVSWLPVTCVSQSFGAEKACTITGASASTQLPDFGFAIGRDAASASAPLLLSVSNLLLPAAFSPLMTGTAWTPSTPPVPPSASLFWPSPSPSSLPTASIGGDGSSRRLCMVRGPQLLGNEAEPSARQIVFGANALTDWQVTLAMHTAQVGIAQREPRAAARMAQCNAPVRCTGQQDAYPSMRLCIDPDCARFAWWELDPVFRECRVRIDIQGALFAIAVAVMGIELFMHCRRLKLEAGVEQLAADQHRMNTEIAEGGDGDDGDDGLALRDGAGGAAAGGAELHADDEDNADGQYEDEW